MGNCFRAKKINVSDTESYLSYTSQQSYTSRVIEAVENDDLEFLCQERSKYVCEIACKLGKLEIVKALTDTEERNNSTLTDQGVLKCIFQGNLVAEECLKYAKKFNQQEIIDYLKIQFGL